MGRRVRVQRNKRGHRLPYQQDRHRLEPSKVARRQEWEGRGGERREGWVQGRLSLLGEFPCRLVRFCVHHLGDRIPTLQTTATERRDV